MDKRYDQTYSLLLAYRDHQIPAKVLAFQGYQQFITEIRSGKSFAVGKDPKQKEMIQAALAVGVISYSFSIIEDFLRLADALISCNDLAELPRHIFKYKQPRDLRKLVHKLTEVDNRLAYRIFWSLEPEEVAKLGFLSQIEREFVDDLHKTNAECVRITFEAIDNLYNSYGDPYNKFKHGFPFLFGWVRPLVGSDIDGLDEALLYFKNPDNMKEVGLMPIGKGALDKFSTILDGRSGSLVSLLRHSVINALLGCRIDGKRIISQVGFGPRGLNPVYVTNGSDVSWKFFNHYGVERTTDKYNLDLETSQSAFKQFEWMLKIPS